MDKFAALSRIASTSRTHISKPFVVEIDGEPWTTATNGFALLAFRGVVDPAVVSPDPATPVKGAVDYLSKAMHSPKREADIKSLREFAGAPEYATVSTCRYCDGHGNLCSCGECVCDACENGKITKSPEQRKADVCGIRCDANLIAKVLSDVPGDSCQVSTGSEKEPISFVGDGWVAVVMPMTKFGDDEKTPSWEPK